MNQFDSSFYDSHVENDDGEDTSVAAVLEASRDDLSVDSDENSHESDDDDESLDPDEDSSVESNLNEREDEDEFTDDELNDDASVEESDDEERVDCSYEEDTDNDEALDITTESKQIQTESTFAESDDDVSVCASDVQELIEKPAASTDLVSRTSVNLLFYITTMDSFLSYSIFLMRMKHRTQKNLMALILSQTKTRMMPMS